MKRLALLALLAVGCAAPEEGQNASPAPYAGFIHVDLLHDGIEGDTTGLNLHFVAGNASLEDPVFDCWIANTWPDWGEPGDVDNPVLSVPLGGALRQQLVYRNPIEETFRVYLTHDWGDISGEAALRVSFEPNVTAHEITAPITEAQHLFDVTWPSRAIE